MGMTCNSSATSAPGSRHGRMVTTCGCYAGEHGASQLHCGTHACGRQLPCRASSPWRNAGAVGVSSPCRREFENPVVIFSVFDCARTGRDREGGSSACTVLLGVQCQYLACRARSRGLGQAGVRSSCLPLSAAACRCLPAHPCFHPVLQQPRRGRDSGPSLAWIRYCNRE